MFQRIRCHSTAAACLIGILVGLSAEAEAQGQVAASTTVEQDLGAKALFYNAAGRIVSVASAKAAPSVTATASRPLTVQPASPVLLALRASALLVGSDGGTREVKPSHAFRSGDRIKLAFTANRTGYFYLAAIGSSGRVQLLAPRNGEAAKIEAGFNYVYPASPKAYFKFDQQPGAEELWAVLSDEPLGAINLGAGKIAEVQIRDATPTTGPAAPAAPADVTALASKDLVFEEDATAAYASIKPAAVTATLPATSTASPNAGKPAVMLKLVLNHQ